MEIKVTSCKDCVFHYNDERYCDPVCLLLGGEIPVQGDDGQSFPVVCPMKSGHVTISMAESPKLDEQVSPWQTALITYKCRTMKPIR